MKNNAIECQEGKVGGGGGLNSNNCWEGVCDDIWTHTHTDQPIHLLSVVSIYRDGSMR